jgi:hypothetical protein
MLPPVQALLSISMSLELKKIPFALLRLNLLRRAQSTDAKHKVNHASATDTADGPDATAGAGSSVNKYVSRVEEDTLCLTNTKTP